MITLAAPITLAADKCNGKTCGEVAFFGVVLMFAVLCGGVFLLLQSSFGVLQGYLISGTAFWASWLVLAIIWFTGVPGIPLSRLQAFKKDIPTSTPRYSGPQGRAAVWLPVTAAERARLVDSPEFIPAAGTQKASDVESIKAAETAAADQLADHYATELGVDKTKITVPGVVLIDEQSTQILRSGGGASSITYVKFISKPATAGETATTEEKTLIGQVKPAAFVLKHDKGTLSWPTRVALPVTFLLFAGHLGGLMWVERRSRPVPATTARQRERERETAAV